jgi:hypothetical protein
MVEWLLWAREWRLGGPRALWVLWWAALRCSEPSEVLSRPIGSLWSPPIGPWRLSPGVCESIRTKNTNAHWSFTIFSFTCHDNDRALHETSLYSRVPIGKLRFVCLGPWGHLGTRITLCAPCVPITPVSLLLYIAYSDPLGPPLWSLVPRSLWPRLPRAPAALLVRRLISC